MTMARLGRREAVGDIRLGAHAAALQPQPALPRSLATASATQQASTIAGAGPPQQVDASTSCSLRHADADARLGQDEPDIVGGLQIAGDRCRHRAGLLVSGQQEEGRRAAIALDADRVKAGLRMRQFAVPMRRHRAAGMQVRIDQAGRAPGRSRARDRGRASARGSSKGPGAGRSRRRCGRPGRCVRPLGRFRRLRPGGPRPRARRWPRTRR